MRGYSAMISVISSSMLVSFDKFRRSMHFDSASPLLRTYYKVIPGGKYRIRIFLSFIFKIFIIFNKLIQNPMILISSFPK